VQTLVVLAICEDFPVDRPHRQELLILGEAIRAVRERHGLSAGGLATAAGVSPARLAALEAGRLDPDFELLLALAEAIGVRPSAFFVTAERRSARRSPPAPDPQ
jgi:transcriptional regulator with XRE-family HTH domain